MSQQDRKGVGPWAGLTAAERHLLDLILRGWTPDEIAAALGQGVTEVEADLARLQAHFGASTRRGMIVRALLHGPTPDITFRRGGRGPGGSR